MYQTGVQTVNDRIRELAEQAGYKPLPGFDFANSLEETYLKKFAELIVQECMTICAEREEDCRTRIKDDGKAAVAYMCRAYIKEHFGVE